MRITLFSVGRLKNGPERELAERYLSRAAASGRALGFSGFNNIELISDRSPETNFREIAEVKTIETVVRPGSVTLSIKLHDGTDADRQDHRRSCRSPRPSLWSLSVLSLR